MAGMEVWFSCKLVDSPLSEPLDSDLPMEANGSSMIELWVSHMPVNFSLPKLLDSSLYVSCWLVEDVAMPSRIYAVKCSVNEDQRHTIGITPINLFHVSWLDGPSPGHKREALWFYRRLIFRLNGPSPINYGKGGDHDSWGCWNMDLIEGRRFALRLHFGAYICHNLISGGFQAQ